MKINFHIPVIGEMDLRGRKPFLRINHPDGKVYDLDKRAARALLANFEAAGEELGAGAVKLRDDLRKALPQTRKGVVVS